jgi:hypothetical protein
VATVVAKLGEDTARRRRDQRARSTWSSTAPGPGAEGRWGHIRRAAAANIPVVTTAAADGAARGMADWSRHELGCGPPEPPGVTADRLHLDV